MLSIPTSRLLLSTQAPHLILAVESSWDRLLGHAPHELVGKSFFVLQGPETDTQFLTSFLSSNEITNGRVILYEPSGQYKMMEISCEPLFSLSYNAQCYLISLECSEAMTLLDALRVTECPCVLLSKEPHCVEMVNEVYLREIGNAAELMNKAACYIKPAETLESTWQEMIETAWHGRRAYYREATSILGGRPVWLEMLFIPVVHLPNGRPEQVLIQFLPTLRECGNGQPTSTVFDHLPPTPRGPEPCPPIDGSTGLDLAAGAPAVAKLAPGRLPRPARPDRRKTRTPLIMDEAHVRRVRRRLVAAAHREGTGRKAAAEA